MPSDNRFRETLALLFSLLLSTTVLPAADKDSDGDGLSDELEQELALLPAVKQELRPVCASKDEKYTDEQAKVNAPDILSLEACHVGGPRLLFKVTFARPPVFANAAFIIYADFDNNPATGRQDEPSHRGVDVMVALVNDQMSLSFHNPAFRAENTAIVGAKRVGNAAYITLDTVLPDKADKIPLGLHLLSQRQGGRGDSTPHVVAELPRSAQQEVPKVTRKGTPDLRPLSDYRFHNGLAKLEKLEDKGLTHKQVAPAQPIQFGRPKPAPIFASVARKPGQAGSVKREQVTVQLLEEAGVARKQTAVSFGFPCPQGALFDIANIRVLSPTGAEVPAQLTATSFWPDDSLKWVLVDFQTPLAVKQEQKFTVEFGSEVKRRTSPSPLKVEDGDATLAVSTGPLKIELDKKRFNLFRAVWLDGKQMAASAAEGVRLVDEHGRLFTTSGRPPDSLRIEEQGPQKVVVRVEGPYAAADGETYMRYIARLTFRAGSTRVALALTHLNDYLKTEFTDITSLSLPLAGGERAAVFLAQADGKLESVEGQPLKLFQLDENTCTAQAAGQERRGGQATGVARRGPVTVAVHDFWQRWPKGFSATANEMAIDLLPPQPSAAYGADLPHYLMFPFVSGKYRFKWGMSFTERVTFDFGGQASPQELLAEANRPVIAVVPGEWYATTRALGPLAAPMGKQFVQWDDYVAGGYRGYVATRDRQREYGYFNYGDWYGERGRNWGNNEYDLAHGFFMQFARTGNRDYFRLALAAARHQADVDCVHAYPDPYFVGGNHLHSIGHTGMWSERPTHGTWGYKYEYHTSAANGHTWADGMMDAWFLTGEPRIMEAALGLGEHIAWAMSRQFERLGTHERSAGWSLTAIMAIYRGTYDREYLEAAKRIAAVALREQKFEDGGAWPHVLPEDHAGGHSGARGNNLFLIGVLLGGLAHYHQESGDPAVRKSLIAGAEWVIKSWNETVEGWPYSASPTGQPYYKANTSLNALIMQPLAYVGHITGDERFIRIAEDGLRALARGGASGSGKGIAQQMHFTAGTMALLQQWFAAHRPDKGVRVLDGTDAGIEKYLAKTANAEEHSVRAPDEKTFFVKLRAETSELVAKRRPHGAMPKRAEFGTIQVLDGKAATVAEGKFSTDGKHEFRCPLKAAPGAVFKVVIRDDQRGVWSLSGEKLGIVMQTVSEFRIGAVGRARFHFFVPRGTPEFRVKLLGVHPGQYGGAALSPDNKVIGYHQAANQGQALILGAAQVKVPKPDEHPERGILTVKPAAQDTGKLWSLALWAATDIGCELDGVPPFLSLTADAWFDPGETAR